MSLKKLYKELNTLKWDSESMGWNLAIEAVLNEIEEMMKETIEDDFIIKDCIECSGKGSLYIHCEDIYERGSKYSNHKRYKNHGINICSTCNGSGKLKYKIKEI